MYRFTTCSSQEICINKKLEMKIIYFSWEIRKKNAIFNWGNYSIFNFCSESNLGFSCFLKFYRHMCFILQRISCLLWNLNDIVFNKPIFRAFIRGNCNYVIVDGFHYFDRITVIVLKFNLSDIAQKKHETWLT